MGMGEKCHASLFHGIGRTSSPMPPMVNTIGTELRDLINSGLARFRMAIVIKNLAKSGREDLSAVYP